MTSDLFSLNNQNDELAHRTTSPLSSSNGQRRLNHIFEKQALVLPQQVAVEAPSNDLQAIEI
jgi:hypothetical protein